MEKLFFFAGIGGSVGGVFLLLYQGISYLMHNDQTSYTVLSVVDKLPEAVQNQVYASHQLVGALGSTPLFVALIVIGLIFLFIGSYLKNRYA